MKENQFEKLQREKIINKTELPENFKNPKEDCLITFEEEKIFNMHALLENLDISMNMNDIMKSTEYYDKSSDGIQVWLMTFETEAKGYGWDEPTMINKVMLAFRGKAQKKFAEHYDKLIRCKNWLQAEKLIKKVFKKEKATIKKRLDELKWKNHENYKIFIKDYKTLKFEINPNEKEINIVDGIISKLPKSYIDLLLTRQLTRHSIRNEYHGIVNRLLPGYGYDVVLRQRRGWRRRDG